jgi:hypothetical protein
MKKPASCSVSVSEPGARQHTTAAPQRVRFEVHVDIILNLTIV